jgi:cytochrome c-type biogenesis protein CcmH
LTRIWRWAPWVLLGVVAVAVLAVGTHRSNHPTLQAETLHIAGLVRCPVCEGQSAAQSAAPASVQIRDQIQKDLTAGEHQSQILSSLTAVYGPGILEKPEASGVSLVVWVVPVVVVVLAVSGLAFAFVRWRPRRVAAVSDADRALVDRALRALRAERGEADGHGGMDG